MSRGEELGSVIFMVFLALIVLDHCEPVYRLEMILIVFSLRLKLFANGNKDFPEK